MPGVTVNLYAAARAAVGAPTVIVQPGSLLQVLGEIASAHPDFGVVWPRCSFLMDGFAVHGEPGAIEVPDGSSLDVLPPFAGG